MKTSIRELARRAGVSDTAINNARADGRLSKKLFGMKESGRPFVIDMDAALAAVRIALLTADTPPPVSAKVQATAPNLHMRVVKPATAPPADIDPDAFDAPDAIDPATGVPKVSVSRARKEHFDAMQAQTKAEQLAGTLINREEVTRAAFSVAREVRDALLQIKDRLADELATMTDANQISKHLDTEFRHALAKLSGEIAVDGPDVG